MRWPGVAASHPTSAGREKNTTLEPGSEAERGEERWNPKEDPEVRTPPEEKEMEGKKEKRYFVQA